MEAPILTPSAEVAAAIRLGAAAAGRCRRRVHLDNDPDADPSARREQDPGARLRADTLAAHRESVGRRLSAVMTLARGWRPQDGSRPDAAWAVRLESESRWAAIDLLLRMPDGGYLPVLVRGHRTTDPGRGALTLPLADLAGWAPEAPLRSPRAAEPASPAAGGSAAPRVAGTSGASPAAGTAGPLRRAAEPLPLPVPPRVSPTKKLRSHHQDSLALAHVYRLLAELGLASDEKYGGIIGFGGSSTDPDWDDGDLIVWHRLDSPAAAGTALDEYDARFADRLAVARAAADRRPALAMPSRVAECRRCPWWTVCGPQLEAAHDVSLLVAGGDVDILRAAGANTYDEVARMDVAVLRALPLTGIPAAEARIRARAMAAGVPMVRRREAVDVRRADVELDVDMESYLDDGAYLWGTVLSGASVAGFPPGYRPFVSWAPLQAADTGANFVAFWRYLSELRARCADRGLTFAAFCYSHKAEERWLYGTPARYPDVPGMPSAREIAAFCGGDQWVDLYQEVKRLFVVPGSLRLKAIAPVAGFFWRDPEPGGENSMAWYRIATGAADTAASPAPAEVQRNRQRILDYNEDDCRATLAIRQWISARPTAMPTVADLAAAYPPDA